MIGIAAIGLYAFTPEVTAEKAPGKAKGKDRSKAVAAVAADKEVSQEEPHKQQQMKHAVQDPYPAGAREAVFNRDVLKAETTICFVGDTGNGSVAQGAVAEQLARHCKQIRHLGDIVYYRGIDSLESKDFRDYFGAHYQNKPEMYLVLGNHDYYKNPDAWLNINTKPGFEKIQFPNHYYLEIFGGKKGESKGLCFLSLDTTPFNNPTKVGKPKPKKTDQEKAKSEERKQRNEDEAVCAEEEEHKSPKAVEELEYAASVYSKSPRVKQQLDWLAAQTKTIEERCHQVFSLAHHPYTNVSNERDDTLTSYLVDTLYQDTLFTMKNFKMVIGGHDHFLGYFSRLPRDHRATYAGLERENRPSCQEVKKPDDYYPIGQIISGSGGMKNTSACMFMRSYALREDERYGMCKRAEAFRENGFVQMKLLTDSNERELAADFTFFNLDGEELGKVSWKDRVDAKKAGMDPVADTVAERPDHRCGPGFGNAKCGPQRCCSSHGWCGDLSERDAKQVTYCEPDSANRVFDGPRLCSLPKCVRMKTPKSKSDSKAK